MATGPKHRKVVPPRRFNLTPVAEPLAPDELAQVVALERELFALSGAPECGAASVIKDDAAPSDRAGCVAGRDEVVDG